MTGSRELDFMKLASCPLALTVLENLIRDVLVCFLLQVVRGSLGGILGSRPRHCARCVASFYTRPNFAQPPSFGGRRSRHENSDAACHRVLGQSCRWAVQKSACKILVAGWSPRNSWLRHSHCRTGSGHFAVAMRRSQPHKPPPTGGNSEGFL